MHCPFICFFVGCCFAQNSSHHYIYILLRWVIELISNVLVWTSSHGRAKARRPARTYILQLREDMEYRPEDLPEAMNNGERWRKWVRDILADDSTRWWWWWWSFIYLSASLSAIVYISPFLSLSLSLSIYIYIYSVCVCVCVCVCVTSKTDFSKGFLLMMTQIQNYFIKINYTNVYQILLSLVIYR